MNKDLDVLTIPQAAKYCGVTRMSMWRWVKAGNINSFLTPDGHTRILKSDLENYIHPLYHTPQARLISLLNQLISHDNKQITTTLKNVRILLVDDNELVVKGLEKLFVESGCKVYTAKDGFEAGVKLKQCNADVLISDLMMPQMDGFELCKFIRTEINNWVLPIIILTGHASSENEKKLAQYVDYYLEKPIDNDELIHTVRDVVIDKFSHLYQLYNYKKLSYKSFDEFMILERDSINSNMQEKILGKRVKSTDCRGKYELGFDENFIESPPSFIDISSNSKEIANTLLLMNEIFSISRHDLKNTSFNISSKCNEYEAILNSIDNKKLNIAQNEYEKLRRIHQDILEINKRFMTQINILLGKRFDNDYSEIFISSPYKIIKKLKKIYSIEIEIDSSSEKTIEIFFPNNLFASIIDELLNNAKKYIKKTIKIFFQWEIKGQLFKFSYHDNGDGIIASLEERQLVFDKLQIKKSGGLKIINTAMTRLDGYMLFCKSHKLSGTQIDLIFPVSKYYVKGKIYEFEKK